MRRRGLASRRSRGPFPAGACARRRRRSTLPRSPSRCGPFLRARARSVRRFPARAFVLAPGGFESGALHVDSRWNVTERALGLPVSGPPADQPIVQEDYRGDHPLFLSGLAVDDSMRVVRPGTDDPVYDNVHAAGGVIAGAVRWTEKSGEGIAIASAVAAADAILKELS